ncbi:hypothetical protein CU664_27465 [Pseudomonas syringae pv. actinidifoliorum]|nr:hypothetical protein [Pseudomonas syringae pv. actinidifoliorum]
MRYVLWRLCVGDLRVCRFPGYRFVNLRTAATHSFDDVLWQSHSRSCTHVYRNPCVADSTTLGHSAHDHLDTHSKLTWTPAPRPLGQAVGAQRRRFSLLV